MKVKYIRVSSIGQNTDRQDDFNGKTYTDECSGSIAFKDRTRAKELLANKDITEVLVHSIDRLGRNTIDIMQTIQGFTKRGINVISEKEGLQTIVDGKENPVAKMMIGILGTLAEFELTRIKERQAEGIAKAKARGVYAKRGESINREKIRELQEEGLTITAIARALDISRMSVYRINKQN